MPHFEILRRVPHSAATMFDLVADVERYPEFLPFCTGLRVLRRIETPDGKVVLTANMTVGYKLIRESFTSRVTLDWEAMRILVQYIDGPFRHLDNRWEFREAGRGTEQVAENSEIDFSIDYSFKSRTFEMLVGTVFDKLFRKMTEAFETRAEALKNASKTSAV